jgi:hypothetical protein
MAPVVVVIPSWRTRTQIVEGSEADVTLILSKKPVRYGSSVSRVSPRLRDTNVNETNPEAPRQQRRAPDAADGGGAAELARPTLPPKHNNFLALLC